MYQSLDMFQIAHQMARHAGSRQAVTAQNIANADTPGYVARQMAPFADVFETHAASAPRATRPGHMSSSGVGPDARLTLANSEPSPNGNAVSIEDEILQSVNIQREHNRALTIYRHTMTVLRTTLGA